MKTLLSATHLIKLLGLGLLLTLLSACVPIAVFSVSPDAPVAEEPVTFDATETIVTNLPEDNKAVAWLWDFGDGKTGRGQSVDHTYAKEGTYTVSLTVTDTAGRVGETKQRVTVGKANPTPQPEPGDDPVAAPETDATSTDSGATADSTTAK